MKFLVDENLSPTLASTLAKAGHDALHIRDLGASGTPDHEVMLLAREMETNNRLGRHGLRLTPGEHEGNEPFDHPGPRTAHPQP